MMEDDFDDAEFTAAAIEVVERGKLANGATAVNGSGTVQQPKPQLLPSRAGPSSIIVSTRQKGNPVLNSIRSLPWEYGDIPSDFVLGNTTCAFFLSLKYHRLHPEYIYARIKSLGAKYNLRVLLTMVDIQNHEEPLKELSKTSLVNNLTLILCWSAQEAGRYLELFKSYEHASPSSIRAHQATSHKESLFDFITAPRNINKTDAVSLVSNFGSIRAAVNARPEEIGTIAGWGEKKVQRWCQIVNEPFRMTTAARRGLPREQSSMVRSAAEVDSDDETQEPELVTHISVGRNTNLVDEEVNTTSTSRKRAAFDVEMPDDESPLFFTGSDGRDSRQGSIIEDNTQRIGKATSNDAEEHAELSNGMQEALAKLRDQ